MPVLTGLSSNSNTKNKYNNQEHFERDNILKGDKSGITKHIPKLIKSHKIAVPI